VHEASDSDIRALLIQAEGPNFSVGGAADEWPDKSHSWFRTFIAEVTNRYRAIEAQSVSGGDGVADLKCDPVDARPRL